MKRKVSAVLLALALVLGMGQVTFAALQVGPINPNYYFPTGNTNSSFPSSYMDDQNVAVTLLPITGDGLNAPTQIYSPPDPANPYSAVLGFESEGFYFFGRSVFNMRNGRATATFGLEASFVNGVAVPGEEMVFARIRLRAPVRDVGVYTFTHPWGTETITVTQADIDAKKAINFTRDVGLVPRAFDLAANGPIQRFVKQLVPAPPAGWIGDGASVGTITPGPNGVDYVKLTGPAGTDLDGRRNNFVQSNQFTISGRVATAVPAALSVQRATCSEAVDPATGLLQEYIDVFAISDPAATVTVSDPLVIPAPFTLTGNGTGKFYGHIPSTGIHSPGPFPITVMATVTGLADTTITANVVDNVNITQATYSPAGILEVAAKSSDGASVLTLKDFNLPVTNDGLTPAQATGIIVPPPTVTVTSSMGGSDTTPVVIVLP